jgi:hypothetical protein
MVYIFSDSLLIATTTAVVPFINAIGLSSANWRSRPFLSTLLKAILNRASRIKAGDNSQENKNQWLPVEVPKRRPTGFRVQER